MGREIRRVPADFDHPLRAVWPGFLRPDELDLPECPACGGMGYSPQYNAHYRRWHNIEGGCNVTQDEVDHLQANGRLQTRVDGSWGTFPVTAAEVNNANRHGRLLDRWVHDSMNAWYVCKYRCAREGAPSECTYCGGRGDVGTPDQVAAHEAWERTDPPEGEALQLWETVSEGSPISPVFDNAEDLAEWMSTNDCTVTGPVPFHTAMKWITEIGWAPSFGFIPGEGLVEGVRLGSLWPEQ